MSEEKKEGGKKRRRNYDIINDNDEIIASIINQMRDAVEADNELNKKKVAATSKLKLLPYVVSQLRKIDLREAFLDSDILSAITEWLAPLPDRSLPHLNIRENLLKILLDFHISDIERIKNSGVGRAVMYLTKHPRETKENKLLAKRLISCWSRPIFNLETDFSSVTREEREQRDLDLMAKKRKSSPPPSSSKSPKKAEEGPQKPGDKGWIPRARVPAPSMKDYVIRPASKAEGDIGRQSRRPANMLEKYLRIKRSARK